MSRHIGVAVSIVVALAAFPLLLTAAPVRVRAPEGTAHGFLVLRDAKGKVLAQGDWWQTPSRDRMEVHLRFRFTDGSLSHETIGLAQRRVWTLVSYRSVQRGPSFPREIEAEIERESGRYTVRARDRGRADAKVDEGTLELPDDVYPFGVLALLLKNLEPGETMTAHAVAFTPKPRLLKLAVTPDGDETVTIQGLPRKASRYVAKAELGGALGAAATVVGKQPPPLRYWMAGEPVPTFLRFDGPLYPEGPIWRVELAAPQWRNDARQ